MKAYGVELRQRVLDDCDQGMTEAVAVKKWKVSRQWIQKIKKQRRETGSILKSILRKEKIRDVGKLHEFLLASRKLFSSIECENCFRHAGYGLN